MCTPEIKSHYSKCFDEILYNDQAVNGAHSDIMNYNINSASTAGFSRPPLDISLHSIHIPETSLAAKPEKHKTRSFILNKNK